VHDCNICDISVTPFGIVTVAKLIFVQDVNVPVIIVTLLGIAGALIRFEQEPNVLTKEVTLFGITGAVVRWLQLEKVEYMLTTLFGIVKTAAFTTL
jgi:hypothetical protein